MSDGRERRPSAKRAPGRPRRRILRGYWPNLVAFLMAVVVLMAAAWIAAYVL